jgi:hypothetical protein
LGGVAELAASEDGLSCPSGQNISSYIRGQIQVVVVAFCV